MGDIAEKTRRDRYIAELSCLLCNRRGGVYVSSKPITSIPTKHCTKCNGILLPAEFTHERVHEFSGHLPPRRGRPSNAEAAARKKLEQEEQEILDA